MIGWFMACGAPDVELELRENPNNPFSLFADVTANEDLDEVWLETDLATPSFPLAAGEQRTVLVQGLLADSETEVRAVTDRGRTRPITWATGPEPEGWPHCGVTNPGDLEDGAIACINNWEGGEPMHLCVDREGHGRWMLAHPEGQATLALTALPDGGFATVGETTPGVSIFDETGALLAEYNSLWFRDRTRYWHGFVDVHDVIPITRGQFEGAIAILTVTEDLVGGDPVVAGGVIVFDPDDGEVLWDWTAHGELGDQQPIDPALDYGRTGAAGEGENWFHVNALIHVVDPDGSEAFWLGARLQDWIVAVDIDTDAVLWRLGNEGDFELTEGEWFFQQHAPELQAHDGHTARLLLFDNGDTRVPEAEEDYSRAVEYELDIDSMTARQTGAAGGFFSAAYGDADMLPGGASVDVVVGLDAMVEQLSWPQGQLEWSLRCDLQKLYRVEYYPSLYDWDWWFGVDR